ncbi:MAG: AMP-binding protein [Brevinematales bacterium]|jgi:acetyl-CoA synthetase
MLEKYLTRSTFKDYDDFYKNFKINIPENFNFAYDVADEWARTDPDKTALVWCDDNGREKSFTFGQLKEQSDRTAGFFKSIGIKKGDPVMLILKRRYHFWFCMLALHKIGAVAIPATHLLTTKDIKYRNNAADIKMIVSVGDQEVLDHVDEAQPETPTLKIKVKIEGPDREGWLDFDSSIEKSPGRFDRPSGPEASVNSDMFLLYFTSGTTGMPKMVTHNFTYPLAHIITSKYWQNVEDNGLHLTVSDTGWAKAAWGKLYGQWLCGSAVFVYDYGSRFKPRDLLGIIEKYGVTTFCAPPTIYRYLIKEDFTQFDFSKLKYCTVAGEPLNPEVYNRFLELTGHKLMEGYGQTELVISISNFKGMEPKPGSMGKPSPGYDVVLFNDSGKPCEIGEEGQLAVRTDPVKPWGIFDGYYRDEDLTKKSWHDGFYYTGDMAWIDEDGFYWFVGRADDLIKSSGYRIGPFEVESALLEHPAVMECAITGVPDPDRGQVVKATVTLAKGYTPSEDLKLELQEHVKKVTAPYKYPRIIEFVTELPKTISGKIRRVEIREGGEK